MKEPAGGIWDSLGDILGGFWNLLVVRSTLGLLALVFAYGAVYWLVLLFRRAYFIEISPFRVWKDPVPEHLPQGLASRLVDELLRLQKDVRDHGRSPESGSTSFQFHKVSWLTPIARQVTLEFKGFSPDALNEFFRHLFRRHVLITTDAIPFDERIWLIGRSATAGPWEVGAPKTHGTGEFRKVLREFAVRAMVEVLPRAREALANALAHKQLRAYEDGDHDEALGLAKLGCIALPNNAMQLYNLGHAYQSLEDFEVAIAAYDAAIAQNKLLPAAHADRGLAYVRLASLNTLQETRLDHLRTAEQSLVRALELEPGNSDWLDTAQDIRKLLEEVRPVSLEH